MKNYPFSYRLKTRWKDMDAFRHINNATILTYIEDARITFFERWNLSLSEKSIIVASIKIDYLQQILHPNDLIIYQKISRIGNKSFDIKSILCRVEDNNILVKSIVTCVCFNYKLNESIPVFQEIILDYNI